MSEPNNIVDHQMTIEISTDGGTSFSEVDHASGVKAPSTKKVEEDVTPSNATNTVKGLVNFTEEDGVEFELPYNPALPEHKALYDANLDGSQLIAQISWTDPRMDKFKFACQVPEFEFDAADPKKKARAKVKLSFAGSVELIKAA